MKTKVRVRFKLICMVSLFTYASLAHEVIVHKYITFNAASAAANISFDYNNFLDVISSDYDHNSAVQWMVFGSAREDDINKDEGGIRSFNHFYDPLTGQGLSDRPPRVLQAIPGARPASTSRRCVAASNWRMTLAIVQAGAFK